jgi:predicted dehydrogenase
MASSDPVGIGIIGCGNISPAYLNAARHFPILDVRGLADANPSAAQARAQEFSHPATSVAALLADPTVEIIVNLTTPGSHVEVGLQALAAGKHVHSEKPLGLTVADARRLTDAAAAQGLRVGCAPDTFLGGGHQSCRALIDAGAIGRVTGGSAFFMCPGHERWHPAPAFYYQVGGGPVLDMGPYYITALVNLIGPVVRVTAMGARVREQRIITSEPLRGRSVLVGVGTHVSGVLEFAQGAVISVTMSFDAAKHRHTPIELHGLEGSMQVPDPNRFDDNPAYGVIEIARPGGNWEPQPIRFGYGDGNYRILGVADMAHAIRAGRPHRASGALALHALEVMEALDTAAQTGRRVDITSTVERPAPMACQLDAGWVMGDPIL